MSKKIHFPLLNGRPSIRILLFKDRKYIDIRISTNEFYITDLEDNHLFEGIINDKFWRIKIKESQPAEYKYFLMLKESELKQAIEDEIAELHKLGHNASCLTVGGEIHLNKRLVNRNEKHILLAGPFNSEKEARHHSNEYGYLDHCRIHRKPVKQAQAVLEIYDPSCEQFQEVQGGIKIIPKKPDVYFELYNFEIKQESGKKPQKENLFYNGQLTVKADEDNNLVGINEIYLEDYLKGVLLSEIEGGISPAYAKSLAIVVRSQVIARFGQYHTAEDFDFCSEGHCLRYYGKKDGNEVINQAIEETSGLVLHRDEKVCNAYFSYSCGGFTENACDVWFKEDDCFSTGKYDGEKSPQNDLDLTVEAIVEQWIMVRPDVYCRQEAADQPHLTRVGSDAFRWEIFYTRQELEHILYEKTGEKPGIIYEIIPLKRGVSGRIKELEILGSLKNVRIRGELNIRSALSETLLNSSCFIVKAEKDEDGVPLNFLFVGAGKGHGVGLCKTGAAKMAKLDKTVEEILAHYFEQSTIKEIY
ncbi:MAG TPA: hypothetical protein EYP36_01235 [Calditrichaeota bacterium]|nr:hypothetical protein [Calditrichota bacterium]